MARDDKNNPHGYEDDFQDGADHAAPQGYEAVPEGEWNPDEAAEPVDDFADDAGESHRVEEADAPMEDDGYHAEGDAEAMEDDYVQQTPEHDEHYEATPEDTVVRAREAQAMKAAGSPVSGLMKYLPYAGAGAVLLAIGFFALQQFTGDAPAPSGQPVAEITTPVDNNVTPPASNGTDVASNNNILPAPDNAGNAPSGAQILQPAPSPQPVVDTAPQQPIQQPPAMVEAPVPASGNNVMVPVPAPSAELENRIAEMNRQLEELKHNNAQLQQQLQSRGPAPDVAALENKVAELESKLASKVAAPAEASSDSQNNVLPQVKKPSHKNESDDALPVQKKTAAKTKKASTDFMAAKLQRDINKRSGGRHASKAKVKVAMDEEPAAPMPREDLSQGWVLRSAQPGVAWLSRGMSADLRRIVPGDKVQGLGTIVSIRQEAGRWLVEGTQSSTR